MYERNGIIADDMRRGRVMGYKRLYKCLVLLPLRMMMSWGSHPPVRDFTPINGLVCGDLCGQCLGIAAATAKATTEGTERVGSCDSLTIAPP